MEFDSPLSFGKATEFNQGCAVHTHSRLNYSDKVFALWVGLRRNGPVETVEEFNGLCGFVTTNWSDGMQKPEVDVDFPG